MKENIKQYLFQIEKERNIKILWACETGSRAWGFPSTDSDYDVRIIYTHKTDWYLSLNNKKDSIDIMLENNNIDISGWELKKSLNLLKKSNAAMFERIQSTIVYDEDAGFILELGAIAKPFYSKIATMHHYLSMAKKGIEDLESKEDFKLKKFFYTLRAASVCRWILEKDEVPPIEFSKVYNNLQLSQKIINRIEELTAIKSKVKETYFHNGEAALVDFIKGCIAESEAQKNTLPTSKGDMDALNNLFRKYIYKYNDY